MLTSSLPCSLILRPLIYLVGLRFHTVDQQCLGEINLKLFNSSLFIGTSQHPILSSTLGFQAEPCPTGATIRLDPKDIWLVRLTLWVFFQRFQMMHSFDFRTLSLRILSKARPSRLPWQPQGRWPKTLKPSVAFPQSRQPPWQQQRHPFNLSTVGSGKWRFWIWESKFQLPGTEVTSPCLFIGISLQFLRDWVIQRRFRICKAKTLSSMAKGRDARGWKSLL